MRRGRGLALATCCALLGLAPAAAEAQRGGTAVALVLPGTSEPLEPESDWPLLSHLPSPDLTVDAHRRSCPSDPFIACARPPRGGRRRWEIYVLDDPDRFTVLHEVGHIVDLEWMTAAARARFRAILRDRRRWFHGPHERFAEAYALCALRPGRLHPNSLDRRGRWVAGDYFYRPTQRQHRSACRLMREVTGA